MRTANVSSHYEMEDPFVNQSRLANMESYPSQQQAMMPPRANVRMPPAVKGTMDQQYRFPHGNEFSNQIPPMFNPHFKKPSISDRISKVPKEYADLRALNDPKAPRRILTRDPHPYTGFAAPPTQPSMPYPSMPQPSVQQPTMQQPSMPKTERSAKVDMLMQNLSCNEKPTRQVTRTDRYRQQSQCIHSRCSPFRSQPKQRRRFAAFKAHGV